MAIEIDKRFSVDAPLERVWAFLTDLERVAECLEGAAIAGRDEDGAWTGTMKVKLGPVSSTYRGTVRFDRADAATHTAALSAEGRDTRGKGGADMTMQSDLTADGDATEVHVASTVHVTGVLARMGRGMIEDVSDQLFQQFTGCMREKLEREVRAPDPSADPSGREAEAPGRKDDERALQLGGMGAQAAGRALGRTLRRPLVWVLAALIALAVWAILG